MKAKVVPFQTDKRTITQDNCIVSAAYKMTLNEKRLLMIAVSKINPQARHDSLRSVDVTAGEWRETYPSSKDPYQDMVRASENLMSRSVFIKERSYDEQVNWLSSCRYYHKEGRVLVRFTPEMATYLSGQLEQFTSYNILAVRDIKSMHALRIYENLARFRTTGLRKWLLNDFKAVLCLDDAYPRFNSLSQRVIQPAVKEINEKTDLQVTWSPHKEGRKIVALSFKFKEKKQKELFE